MEFGGVGGIIGRERCRGGRLGSLPNSGGWKERHMSKEKLTVYEMPVEDSWKDMARIPKNHRVDVRGKRIRRATICNVTIGDKNKLLALRGCRDRDARILLDSSTRLDLDVQVGESYEVELHRVGWLGYWRWAWDAADPAYRVPAQISLISLVLGVIGLLLGALSLWPFVNSWLQAK